MFHHQIVGYAVDGETYCAAHAPEDSESAIYAGDESAIDCPECRAETDAPAADDEPRRSPRPCSDDCPGWHVFDEAEIQRCDDCWRDVPDAPCDEDYQQHPTCAAALAVVAGPPKPLAVGARVRCAYREGHVGTLLAIDDPRAWKGSLKFPGDALPDQTACTLHVRTCQLQGLLCDERRPVLWDFPRPGELPLKVVYWDGRLSRVERPTFSRGFTPREVLACHAREHCGDEDFPMCIKEAAERWALARAGYHCDSEGRVRVPSDELADLLVKLQDIADNDRWHVGVAADDLRGAIVELLGVEEV
jgi:hypothetical protein